MRAVVVLTVVLAIAGCGQQPPATAPGAGTDSPALRPVRGARLRARRGCLPRRDRRLRPGRRAADRTLAASARSLHTAADPHGDRGGPGPSDHPDALAAGLGTWLDGLRTQVLWRPSDVPDGYFTVWFGPLRVRVSGGDFREVTVLGGGTAGGMIDQDG